MSDAETAKELLQAAIQQLHKEAKGANRMFFPNGVELLDVAVQVGLPQSPVVKVELKAAGPNPKTTALVKGGNGQHFMQLKDGLWKLKKPDGGLVGYVWVEEKWEHWFTDAAVINNLAYVKMEFLGTEGSLEATKDASRGTFPYFACWVVEYRDKNDY